MTLKQTITKYLETEPRARERHFKDRAMVNVLLKSYPQLEAQKDTLIEFCHEFNNADRLWRQILSERPDLQGKDYDTKTNVSQKKMLELGYDPLYNRKIHA